MSESDPVRRLSGALYFGTIAIMVVLFISGLGLFFGKQLTAEDLQLAYPSVQVAPDISRTLMIAVVATAVVPFLIWLWTLNQMRRLFDGYRQGDVLTDQSAYFIQRIGLGFFGIAVVQIALVPIRSVLLTWANPVGERSLSLGVSSEMIGFLIAAGLMTVIGWAMRDASAIAAENKRFI